jgi:hypothetical protein
MSEAVAGETATEVTTGTGGSVVTPVPPSEHTASCGRNNIQHQWRAILPEVENLFGMSLSPAGFRVEFREMPGNKMPPRHRLRHRIRWRLGWHGGIRYSPVALRRRLSTVVL